MKDKKHSKKFYIVVFVWIAILLAIGISILFYRLREPVIIDYPHDQITYSIDNTTITATEEYATSIEGVYIQQ